MSDLLRSVYDKARDWVARNPKLSGSAAALAVAYVLYQTLRPQRSYRNKVVLITGGGNGLGRLMALRFALLGARVVLWDINAAGLDAVAREIAAALAKRNGGGAAETAAATSPTAATGSVAADHKHPSGAGASSALSTTPGGSSPAAPGVVYTYVCDVSDPRAVASVAACVRDDVGDDVDLLINNAGVVSGRFVDEMSDDAIRRTFGVNTLSLFWTTRAFLPGMMRKKRGHICNIASAAGLVGISKMTDYSASKFAAVGMTESLRNELAHRGFPGIRTTLVCPYYINTGMFAGVRSNPILPILDEHYVVDRIVRAIRTDTPVLQLPALVNLLAPLRLLPVGVFDWLGNVLRLNTTMDHFAGRSIDPPKPKDAATAATATAAAK